jgi:putative transposase
MNKFGIKPPRRKIKHYCTKSTNHHNYTNLITDFVPEKPHDLWCSDLSYIKFQGKFWYLATIEDNFTRQIVSAQMGKHHDQWLVLASLKQALTKNIPKIFHCDQGTEYMAKNCTDYLKAKKVKISVSDKGSPWQNGFQESFFGRFKDEFGNFNRFKHPGQLIEEIYSQIHYYNTKRRHTSLKMAPAVYASRFSDICHQKRGT